jgi:uncharacterized protein YdaU (DUF1376 family)
MGRAWLPLYVGDYLRDTRDLNTLQHGAYLLLIMHYWQHDGLPSDDARLAAIAGLTVAQWRRIREPVQAKFADGWRHKRIDAELARADRVFLQRRLAGRNGGIKSGIARAVQQGEAIIRAQAEAKRMLARRSSGRAADGPAAAQQPQTNHNHRFESPSVAAPATPSRPAVPADEASALKAPNAREGAPDKPANQWSRQELDALFARRGTAGSAESPAPAPDPSPEPETGA